MTLELKKQRSHLKFLGFVKRQGLILHISLGINSDTGCTEEYKE